MPCRCDYMEPDRYEKESNRAAKLIRYVLESQGKRVPKDVLSISTNEYGDKTKINELVVKLCSLCRNMSPNEQDSIIFDGRNKTARDLADWWEEHQEADRKRIEKDKKEFLRMKKEYGWK